jgi:serine phosphatase RsbU (regulator of sigma subunit)
MFATLFYGILNTRTGVLEYANAGHNPPYLLSPGGALRALKDLSGPMLGVFDGLQYLTQSTEVQPGEGLLVYTDGVTEARDSTATSSRQRVWRHTSRRAPPSRPRNWSRDCTPRCSVSRQAFP